MAEGITFECSNTLELETLPCFEFEGDSNPIAEDAAPQLFHAQYSDMAKKRAITVVQSGRLGGAKGGRARAANMTPEERSASASVAGLARWGRTVKMTPEEALEAKRLRARRWDKRRRDKLTAAWRAAGLPPKKPGRPPRAAAAKC